MPFRHGSKTSVWYGGLDLSPYLTAADLDASFDTADTTTFGATWKTSIPGTQGAATSFTGYYDPTMLDLENSIAVDFALTTGVLTYCPAGAIAIGDDARLMSVVTADYKQSSPVGGVVAVNWTPATSSAIGMGDVLHLFSADTNTTTGAEKDDVAATSLGWVAHLHISGVTGAGTWVVKLQDAAVSGTYSDLAGGAFTSVSGKSTQRLLSATNTTTLRRYIRYVATRTGGTAGDTITFGLAYARNI